MRDCKFFDLYKFFVCFWLALSFICIVLIYLADFGISFIFPSLSVGLYSNIFLTLLGLTLTVFLLFKISNIFITEILSHFGYKKALKFPYFDLISAKEVTSRKFPDREALIVRVNKSKMRAYVKRKKGSNSN